MSSPSHHLSTIGGHNNRKKKKKSKEEDLTTSIINQPNKDENDEDVIDLRKYKNICLETDEHGLEWGIVHVMFLEWGNDYMQRSCFDSIAKLITGPISHVQIAFDVQNCNDKDDRCQITFSVDAIENDVFCDTTKTYSKDGWLWFKWKIPYECANYMYRQCKKKIGCQYNSIGLYCVICCGWSGNGKGFFCSELVATIFKETQEAYKDKRDMQVKRVYYDDSFMGHPSRVSPTKLFDFMSSTDAAKESHPSTNVLDK